MIRSFFNLSGGGHEETRGSMDDSESYDEDDSVTGSVRHHRLWSRSDRKMTKDQAIQNSIRDLTANDLHIMRALDEKRKHAILNFDVDRRELDRLAVLLRARLHLSVHRRLIHAYEDCFRGADAVTWLISNSVCTDPDDAKNILRHLLYRRIILRIDHTKPLLNSAIHSVAPGLAEWRRRKQLDWYQTGVQKYSMNALYTFNVGAFAKYKLVVRLVAGRGLRYTRHNRILGRWEPKRIAPLASVTLGTMTANTSVEEKTSEPTWDESFTFYFDYTLPRHDEVWIKVFDFREVGESFPLGVICVSTKRILKQCRVSAEHIPPIYVQDAPGWLAWHPLLPPATTKEPDEVRGGELQIEFQVITNIVDTPDSTVHDECRPKREEALAQQNPVDPDAQSRLDSDHHRARSPSTLPRSVMQYQHVDRRPEKEIYAPRALLEAQQQPHEPSTVSRRPKAQAADQGGRNVQSQAQPIPVERWQTCITSLEIRDVTDIPPGTVTWIEVLARSPKRSEYLAKRRAEASKGKRRDMENDTGIIARKRSPRFLWPKDNRPVVKAGAVSVPVPDDVAKYTVLEFRLVRRKDLPTSVVAGRGKLSLQYIRRSEDADSDSDLDSDDDVDDDDDSFGIDHVDTQVDPDRDEVDLDSTTLPARLVPSATQESLPTIGGGSVANDEDDRSQIPTVDELKPQPPIDPTSQDAHFVVLRKQAAFKRNIKIKCGQIYCYAKMRPLLHDEGLFDVDESVAVVDPTQDSHVDIEDALKAVVPTDPEETPRKIDVPEPLTNLYVDENVPGTVQQIAIAFLGSNSKFTLQFAKERKNTNVTIGPWKLPEEGHDADGAAVSDGDDDDDEEGEEQGPHRSANGDDGSSGKSEGHDTRRGDDPKGSLDVKTDTDADKGRGDAVAGTANDSESSFTELPEGSIRGMFTQKKSSTSISKTRPPLSVTTKSEDAIKAMPSDGAESTVSAAASKGRKAQSEAALVSPGDPASKASVSTNGAKNDEGSRAGKATSTSALANDAGDKNQGKGEGEGETPKIPKQRGLARQESNYAMRAGDHVDSVTYPTRTITFTLPTTSLTKSSECTETQRIVKMEPGGFIYTSTSETPGVPYGERFFTHVQFVVTYISPAESHVRISGEVRYYEGKAPPTFPVKGFILSGVKNGHSDAYGHQMKMLREYLMAKNRQSRAAKPVKKGRPELDTSQRPAAPSTLARLAHFARLVLLPVAVLLLAYFLAVVFYSAFQESTVRDTLALHRDFVAGNAKHVVHLVRSRVAGVEDV